jgi:hypothetical protein
MENLPNDIIMRIIREADGGRYTHKKKFTPILTEIKTCGEIFRKMCAEVEIEEEDSYFTEYLWG